VVRKRWFESIIRKNTWWFREHDFTPEVQSKSGTF
jgi:hypothetical protein